MESLKGCKIIIFLGYLAKVVRVGVDNRVPEGVELTDSILSLDGEAVTSSVTFLMVGGVSSSGMEWLMDIGSDVNKHPDVEAVSESVVDVPALEICGCLSFGILQRTDQFSLRFD